MHRYETLLPPPPLLLFADTSAFLEAISLPSALYLPCTVLKKKVGSLGCNKCRWFFQEAVARDTPELSCQCCQDISASLFHSWFCNCRENFRKALRIFFGLWYGMYYRVNSLATLEVAYGTKEIIFPWRFSEKSLSKI